MLIEDNPLTLYELMDYSFELKRFNKIGYTMDTIRQCRQS